MATTATPIHGADQQPPSRPLFVDPTEIIRGERDALILQYLADVRCIASGIARRLPRHVQLDDLVQAGTIGLIDAVTRFDRQRPLGLRQYVRVRVTGAILDSLREQDWASRYMRTRQQKLESVTRELESRLGRRPESDEIADEMGMDLQSFYEFASTVEEMHQAEDNDDDGDQAPVLDTLSQDPELAPDALYARLEQKHRLQDAMGYLKAEHRRVLRLYYFEELTMSQIATEMKVSESRISQVHARALEELSSLFKRGRRPRIT